MPPEQPLYTPQPQPGKYDFIVQSQHPTGSNWLLQASLRTRIIVVGGSFVFLLILIWIFLSILSSSGTNNVGQLISLTQQQAELVHISQDPITQANSNQTRNFASTTDLSISTDKTTTLAYINLASKAPSSPSSLTLENKAIDTQLNTAKSNGTYDQTYMQIAQAKLATYALALKQAYASSTTTRERTLLKAAYDHVQLLITLGKQSSG
jgi:hypothetical protein